MEMQPTKQNNICECVNNCFPLLLSWKTRDLVSRRRTANKWLEIQTPSRGGCQNFEIFFQSNEPCWSHSCNELRL